MTKGTKQVRMGRIAKLYENVTLMKNQCAMEMRLYSKEGNEVMETAQRGKVLAYMHVLELLEDEFPDLREHRCFEDIEK